jgi:hypothetical protein
LQKLAFFCVFCHFFAKIYKNYQKCALLGPEFSQPQNQGKNRGRKVKGENQKFFTKFLIFQGIRTSECRTSGYLEIKELENARCWILDTRYEGRWTREDGRARKSEALISKSETNLNDQSSNA